MSNRRAVVAGSVAPSERGRARAKALALLVGMTLLAAGLRAWNAGARDFWFDESCTHVHVRELSRTGLRSLPLGEGPLATYYALTAVWTHVFGESETGYRSLSVVTSALSVGVLGGVARNIGGRGVGWVCALFAMASPLSVYYAREARPYANWMLLLSVAFALLLRAAQRNRRRDWAAFGVALVVTLHFHAFTVWWVPWSGAIVAVSSDPRTARRRWLVTVLAVGAAYLPMLTRVVIPVSELGSNAWIGDAPAATLPIVHSISAFLPAGDYPAHLRGLSLQSADTFPTIPKSVSTAISLFSIAVVVILMSLSLLSNRRANAFAVEANRGNHAATRSIPTWKQIPPLRVHAVLAAMSLGPLLLIELYSTIGRPCYVVGRYDLVAWPAFVVWVAVGVVGGASAIAGRFGCGAKGSRVACAAACGLMIASSLDPLSRMNRHPPGPSFARARAERLASLAGVNDLVVAFNYDRAYLAYYLDRARFRGRIRSFPSSLDTHIGWVDTRADLASESEESIRKDAEAWVAAIDETHRQGGSVWWLPDSLDPFEQGPRAPIHRVLRDALGSRGYTVKPVDERMIVSRVER